MKTRTVSMILIFLLIAGAGIPAVAAVPEPIPAEPLMMMEGSPDLTDMDFLKLQISPRHAQKELMPGESDEITVTVTNKNNVTVQLNPTAVVQPYSEYIFDEDWITTTPASAELGPDDEVEFTISVAIPDEADRGYYSLQVAFTDAVMPTPYPSPYPMYLNALDLHINVWTPPAIQIQPSYIYDRVESGKGYDYQINLKNIGEEDIEIDPKHGGEQRYGYDMGMMSAFENDAITIDAPQVVPAGGTATIALHLTVPEGAKGRYEGGLDLNIKDPSIDEWNGMIHLSFEVWTQPTKPFVKTFSVEIAEPITIEIESNQYRHYTCGGESGGGKDEDPSFDVTLKKPSGDDVTLTRTMATYRGSVNLGGSDCIPPWEIDSRGM
ncbi:MAG: hypothetical protein U9N05_01725, partial [Euryarchaeota archaeon]|nr:hypothetical protein [Euryarchaeota archaeon]